MTSSSLNVGDGLRGSKPTKNFPDREKECQLIIQALHSRKQPLTRRKLSQITGLEIANLCRLLYNLTYKRKVLEIAKYGVCPITGKNVMHYYFSTPTKEVTNAV